MSRRTRWPWAPVERHLLNITGLVPYDAKLHNLPGHGAYTDDVAAEILGHTRGNINRYRRTGVPTFVAERITEQLHIDPLDLWPDWNPGTSRLSSVTLLAGHLLVACWCAKDYVDVPQTEVLACRTASCGRRACQPFTVTGVEAIAS